MLIVVPRYGLECLSLMADCFKYLLCLWLDRMLYVFNDGLFCTCKALKWAGMFVASSELKISLAYLWWSHVFVAPYGRRLVLRLIWCSSCGSMRLLHLLRHFKASFASLLRLVQFYCFNMPLMRLLEWTLVCLLDWRLELWILWTSSCYCFLLIRKLVSTSF